MELRKLLILHAFGSHAPRVRGISLRLALPKILKILKKEIAQAPVIIHFPRRVKMVPYRPTSFSTGICCVKPA